MNEEKENQELALGLVLIVVSFIFDFNCYVKPLPSCTAVTWCLRQMVSLKHDATDGNNRQNRQIEPVASKWDYSG